MRPIRITALILAVAVSLSGCSLMDAFTKPAPEVKPVEPPKPCEVALQEKKDAIQKAFEARTAASSVVGLIQSANPACDHTQELYMYALRLGRYDVDTLLSLAYAVYRNTLPLSSSRSEFSEWMDQVTRTDLVDRLLHALWRLERLTRAGRMSTEEYSMNIRKVTEFFSWFASARLPDVRSLAQSGIDPTLLEIPELRLLTHSYPAYLTYFAQYAAHPILGNRANFDAMEGRLSDTLTTRGTPCEWLGTLRLSGLSVLEIGPDNILQVGRDMDEAPDVVRTDAPAFVRNPSRDSVENRFLFIVPRASGLAFEEWPSSDIYLLRPVRSEPGYGLIVESLFRERVNRKEDPTLRVLRQLGKIPSTEDLTPAVRIAFSEPTTYRIVSRMDRDWFQDMHSSCGVAPKNIVRIP